MSFQNIESSKDLLKQLVKCTQEECKRNGLKNESLFSIFDKLEEMDYDENFFELVKSHIKTLSDVLTRQKSGAKNFTKLEFESKQEQVDFVVSQIFIENIKSFSKVEVKDKSEKQFDFEVPYEAFLKPNEIVAKEFVNDLNKYDILYGEIINLNIMKLGKEMIQLRLINKVGKKNTIVYHLNISAFLLKCEELNRLEKKDAVVGEVMKVAVLGFLPNEPKKTTFVSTNVDAFRHLNEEQKSTLHLGFASTNDLPFNLCSFKSALMFSSYAQYLRSNPDFLHLLDLNDMMESLGIDPFRIYAFSENRDGLTCPSTSKVSALKFRAELDMHVQSNLRLRDALKFVEKKEVDHALIAFDESLKMWKKNYKVYEARGKMFVDIYGLKSSSNLKRACLDFENAISLNPSAKVSKEYYSKIFIYFAEKMYMKKRYETAKTYILAALALQEANERAIKLLGAINKKIIKGTNKDVRIDKEYLKELEKQMMEIVRRVKVEK